mmetsp:Transcript_53084/g.153083  ORF Transcript_53084/g.153083 Transcript_53084/m.153083 type:complete len:213 (-) Transcript_53084:1519-2157(-)
MRLRARPIEKPPGCFPKHGPAVTNAPCRAREVLPSTTHSPRPSAAWSALKDNCRCALSRRADHMAARSAGKRPHQGRRRLTTRTGVPARRSPRQDLLAAASPGKRGSENPGRDAAPVPAARNEAGSSGPRAPPAEANVPPVGEAQLREARASTKPVATMRSASHHLRVHATTKPSASMVPGPATKPQVAPGVAWSRGVRRRSRTCHTSGSAR